MISDDLASRILDSTGLQDLLGRIARRSVANELQPLRTDAAAESVIDWATALTAAGALGFARGERPQAAALGIAQACLTDPDSTFEERQGASIVLERLGNVRAIQLAAQRELVKPEAWTNASPIARLEVVRRRLELGIHVHERPTIHANPFQRAFWTAAYGNRWLSVSAPTSAGKSHIVREWFAEQLSTRDAFRGVYIVPTRALIDEVGQDLMATLPSHASVFSIPWDRAIGEASHEVHVLTQERAHLLLERFPDFKADLVFIDEAQKFGDSQRGVLLQRVLDELVVRARDAQFVFASPLAANPELLLAGSPTDVTTKALISETVTVSQNLIWVNQEAGDTKAWKASLLRDGVEVPLGRFQLTNRPNSLRKRLAFVAASLGEQSSANLVYVNGAADAEKVALLIADSIAAPPTEKPDPDIVALEELVATVIHPKYALLETLERGVAFHYGNMPLLVRAEIERLFRVGKLRYLVCTSTLLEGVNLPCRNLFVRGPRRGKNKPMSPGDFWNLAGRAGRWGHEFQGNIVCLDTTDVGAWPDPPVRRQRAALSRATDPVLQDSATLLRFIAGEIPMNDARRPMLEAVFSFLASRVGRGESLRDVPAAGSLADEDAEVLELAVDRALQALSVPYDVYARNAGISPLYMEHLLAYFRSHRRPDSLFLAQPEDSDAAQSYVRALGRTTRYLGAPFGTSSGRHWVLAILLTQWMRGRPLAMLITERINYWAGKGDLNTAAHIRSTMQDIEQVARFEAPKYLGCYNDLLRFHLSETGQDTSRAELFDVNMLLELGVSTDTEVALMTLGLSRTTAIALAEQIAADGLTREACVAWIASHELEGRGLPSLVLAEIQRTVEAESARP